MRLAVLTQYLCATFRNAFGRREGQTDTMLIVITRLPHYRCTTHTVYSEKSLPSLFFHDSN